MQLGQEGIHIRPGANPGANGWFLQSTAMQTPPQRGGICGRLTDDLPSTRLQGGDLGQMSEERRVAQAELGKGIQYLHHR